MKALALAALLATAAPAHAVSVLAAGDIGKCELIADAYKVGDLIRSHSGMFLALGDLAYLDGTKEQFAQCYDKPYHGLKHRTRPVPGNHEYNTPGAAGYYDYFGIDAYYAYNLGEWRLYALNTGCAAIEACFDDAQLAWLKADLAASPQQCKLAYMHHPHWSSGELKDHNTATSAVVQALFDGKVSLLLSGHEHNYERFAPQSPSEVVDPNGVRQFIVGTGGANLRPAVSTAPNSEARGAKHGVLRLELGSADYSWEFLPVTPGSYKDSGSASCVG